MENPVLIPGQQLAAAALTLPVPRGEVGTKLAVAVPCVGRTDASAIGGSRHRPETEQVEFELAAFSANGSAPALMWRFDGKLFVDHWVEPSDIRKLCLFIELACKAKAVSVHRREDELVSVSVYFAKGASRTFGD